MSDPYVGEIRMFGANFPPYGWLLCQGQRLPMSDYEMLFNLIGTTYGGDGVSTFQLPDLRGRVPIHTGNQQGNIYVLGQTGGVESVTLTRSQLPSHSHNLMGSVNDASTNSPFNAVPGSIPTRANAQAYGARQPYGTIDPGIIQPAGGSQAHTNIQPYVCINFIISYNGAYPPPGVAGDEEGASSDG